MRTLPPSLIAHQGTARRRPALRAILSRRRAGIALLAFGEPVPLAGSEVPHALAISDAGTAVQLVNDGGLLRARRAWGGWSGSLAALPVGSPVAAAAVPGEVVAAFADGAAVRTVHSFDDGATWSSPVTRVTAAGDVGSLALAGRQSNGNLCLFFTVGAAPTVYRLRRTAGTWAATPTGWTAGAAWSAISGLAALHAEGNFHLIVAGTGFGGEAVAAAYVMGDGSLPSNVWFGPRVIAAADAAALVTFDRPTIAWYGLAIGGFREVQAAPVAGSRIKVAQAVGSTLAPWSEPLPLAPAPAFGIALAAGSTQLVAASVAAYREALLADQVDSSAFVRAFRWRQGPTASSARLELVAPAGLAESEPLLAPGVGIEVSLGYASGLAGGPEFGPVFRGSIAAVERRRRDGVESVILACDGPWERLGAFRAPATWQAAPGSTRGEALTVLAAKAGIPVTSALDLPPSGAWTTETAGFAIQVGEPALPPTLRLLEPTPDAFRAETGLEICGLSATDPPVWKLGPGGHPLLSFEPTARALPAWVRVAGPDRTAEAYDGTGLLRDGPALAFRRELGATTDPLAETFAQRLLARLRRGVPLARARVPFHAGLQLYDVVQVVHPLAPGGSASYRVIAMEIDYRAGLHFETRLVFTEVA